MRLSVLVLIAAVLSGLPAAAQQILPREAGAVLNVARSFGSADFDGTDSDGRPQINGNIDGVLYGIVMYGCDNPAGCESVQMFASFESDTNNTLAFVNDWNFDRRYATAYLTGDGTVVLAHSVNIEHGITRDNFFDTFDIWQILLTEFNERIFDLPPAGGTATTTTPPRPTK